MCLVILGSICTEQLGRRPRRIFFSSPQLRSAPRNALAHSRYTYAAEESHLGRLIRLYGAAYVEYFPKTRKPSWVEVAYKLFHALSLALPKCAAQASPPAEAVVWGITASLFEQASLETLSRAERKYQHNYGLQSSSICIVGLYKLEY
ncbi:unnamed protein product [Somion occarium]|uniref:Uncharacterized protein n=1 Tax=Somion occarium TaxID=3059160 RepID=A0ABP1CQ80_9APHY